MTIALLFVITIVFILIRIPLGAGMLLASLIVVVIEGLRIEIVPLRIFESLLPFPILAVPLFYVAGIACNATTITAQIMDLAHALVGRLRAGLAHVNIVSSMLFAGISGSSLADTAGIGSVLMPQMIKAGYSKSFVVALTATTSTLGNIVPPSLVMVAYGAFGNVSVGMLFLGGIIPGLMFGFLMMGLVIFLCTFFGVGKDDHSSERVPILPALRGGWAPGMVPVIIVGGIVGGVFTATESAAVAILYILILGLVRRELSLKEIIKLTGDTGKFIGVIMPLLAASVVLAWFLSFYEFPTMIVGAIRCVWGWAIWRVVFHNNSVSGPRHAYRANPGDHHVPAHDPCPQQCGRHSSGADRSNCGDGGRHRLGYTAPWSMLAGRLSDRRHSSANRNALHVAAVLRWTTRAFARDLHSRHNAPASATPHEKILLTCSPFLVRREVKAVLLLDNPLLPHFGKRGFAASCSEMLSMRLKLVPHSSQRYSQIGKASSPERQVWTANFDKMLVVANRGYRTLDSNH